MGVPGWETAWTLSLSEKLNQLSIQSCGVGDFYLRTPGDECEKPHRIKLYLIDVEVVIGFDEIVLFPHKAKVSLLAVPSKSSGSLIWKFARLPF